MKRVNFVLIECQEELAGARQAIVCLSGAMVAALLLILTFFMQAMTALILFSGLGVIGFLCGLGTLCVLLPEWRERRREHERLHSDFGRCVE